MLIEEVLTGSHKEDCNVEECTDVFRSLNFFIHTFSGDTQTILHFFVFVLDYIIIIIIIFQ